MLNNLNSVIQDWSSSQQGCSAVNQGEGVRVQSKSLNGGELDCSVTEIGVEHRVILDNLRAYTTDYQLVSQPTDGHLTYEAIFGDTWQISPASDGGNAEPLPPSFDADDPLERLRNRINHPQRIHNEGVKTKDRVNTSDQLETKAEVTYIDVDEDGDLSSGVPVNREDVTVRIDLEIEVTQF